VSAVCLLDLTAALDTVDHGLLLARLHQCFGIESSCLAWFTSYLTDRTYYVVVDGVFSRAIQVMCSVLKGSVIGPQILTPNQQHQDTEGSKTFYSFKLNLHHSLK